MKLKIILLITIITLGNRVLAQDENNGKRIAETLCACLTQDYHQ